MNGDDLTLNGEEVQITDEPDADDELDRELADDVDATIERLGELISIDSDKTMTTPFGEMTEADLLGLIRPSLWQYVGSKRDTALAAVALIHKSTGDLLDKHAPERDVDELARSAIEDE